MSNESRDRKALRSIVNRNLSHYCGFVCGNEIPINEIYEARASLAQPEPAQELYDALSRIMEYAYDGAAIRDVNPKEQPQFIAANVALAKWEDK